MAIKGYFFNAEESGGVYDRVYNAEDVTSYLDKLVGNGVFPTPSNQLQVRASSGMEIIVGAGQGFINGHKLINTADMPLTVESADPIANRIDRVVFYADFTNRVMGIRINKGTAAVSPQAPALTRNSTLYEMSLATIQVNKQITAITGSMIADTRANTSVCGWVAGLIQQVDTSTLFTQWETAYNEYYTTTKQELDDFMETLTQELAVNTYVKKFKMVHQGAATTIEMHSPGFYASSTDIVEVYFNGLKGIVSDYSYEISGSHLYVTLANWSNASAQDKLEVVVTKSIIGIEETV